jgi:uncharacterized membrane protein
VPRAAPGAWPGAAVAHGKLPDAMKTRSALERLLAAVAIGVVAGGVTAFFAPWQMATLVAWDAVAVAYVASVWMVVSHFSPDETSELATREDGSRVIASVLLLSAAVASLVGTGLDLVKASQAQSAGRVTLTVVGVVTVALSWAVVQTVFALRYAHEYYTPPIGGIDFKSDERPDYLDFAYVAFTVGMTFQVSDTDIQRRQTRRTVTRHALLAYLFGAVILAVVVNVIATLLNS